MFPCLRVLPSPFCATSHFPDHFTGGLLFCENKRLNNFHIQRVVEASSCSLNHNTTLESKDNYPWYTQKVQISLGFMPEEKSLHEPRGDGVVRPSQICVRRTKLYTVVPGCCLNLGWSRTRVYICV